MPPSDGSSPSWARSTLNDEYVLEADKEYKARVVFAGNNIQTASGVAPHELFQEVSSAPAAMASVRATLAVGALCGWRPMMRDAA